MEYAWYGNVRELENIIERLVTVKDGLDRDTDLPPYFFVYLHNLEQKEEILKALDKTGYVKSRATPISLRRY